MFFVKLKEPVCKFARSTFGYFETDFTAMAVKLWSYVCVIYKYWSDLYMHISRMFLFKPDVIESRADRLTGFAVRDSRTAQSAWISFIFGYPKVSMFGAAFFRWCPLRRYSLFLNRSFPRFRCHRSWCRPDYSTGDFHMRFLYEFNILRFYFHALAVVHFSGHWCLMRFLQRLFDDYRFSAPRGIWRVRAKINVQEEYEAKTNITSNVWSYLILLSSSLKISRYQHT